jgi:hypothetical protein
MEMPAQPIGSREHRLGALQEPGIVGHQKFHRGD